jgi:hypothetical protein
MVLRFYEFTCNEKRNRKTNCLVATSTVFAAFFACLPINEIEFGHRHGHSIGITVIGDGRRGQQAVDWTK